MRSRTLKKQWVYSLETPKRAIGRLSKIFNLRSGTVGCGCQDIGNAHGVIKGIGVVTCMYINPELDQFWIIDYRIYDPVADGKTKLDHVREMLNNALYDKQLPFRGVLMDSWYAERKLMLHIERLNQVYYCPLKDNRQVDESAGGYQRVDSLSWTDSEVQHGKTLHIKDFPKGHQVKVFRLVHSTERTDYVATNDMAQDSTQDTQ